MDIHFEMCFHLNNDDKVLDIYSCWKFITSILVPFTFVFKQLTKQHTYYVPTVD
jgi:RNAse (barnase) inhibitor barstar